MTLLVFRMITLFALPTGELPTAIHAFRDVNLELLLSPSFHTHDEGAYGVLTALLK
jgi:hypothetical protein